MKKDEEFGGDMLSSTFGKERGYEEFGGGKLTFIDDFTSRGEEFFSIRKGPESQR